jgi:putative ABC transport system permease protein
MLKNYFRIIWRNFLRDRQFSLLNLAGFSTGLACALLIWLWANDERHMDKWNEKDGQLYQVMQNMPQSNGMVTMENTAGLLAKALGDEMPEVQYACSVIPAKWFSNSSIVTYKEHRLKTSTQFVSEDYFNMFTIQFLQGNKNTVLSGTRSIAISDELAMKLFHTTENIIGKTIDLTLGEFNGNYTIAGIFQKNPSNQFDKFDMLVNFNVFVAKRPWMLKWENSDPSTYVLLKNGTNIAAFNNKIKNFIQTKTNEKEGKTYFVRRFSDKYLYGDYKNGLQAGGRIVYVKLFSFIALFILIIACINFMNLSTAKATRRIKEVGVQKVVGARRRTLILQYLGESVLMSFISLFLAIALIVILLPAFNIITGKTINLEWNSSLVLSALSITLLTGLVAGSYPAFYISGFKPALILKGKVKAKAGELWLRKGLVVFQFCLSAFAIVTVLVVYRQVQYIQSKNLGYNRDHVIHFELPLEMDSASLSSAAIFIEELNQLPGVLSAGSYAHNLTGDHGGIGGFQWPGKDPSMDIDFANLEVGKRFLETVGIKIKEGHSFSADNRAQKEIVFNESAIKAMGLKDPIGKTVKFWDREREIVGIAEDFNFESLYQPVKPCFFQIYPVAPNAAVRLKAGTEKQTIERIRQLYAGFSGGLEFDYRFLDEDYRELYQSESRVAQLSKYFAGLAILISCLGLFGLAAFTAQRRQKEIGIRKVIGASTGSIIALLSTGFFKLVLLAVLIAFPLAGWIMNEWLSDFAYHTQVNSIIFIIAGGSILLITLLTISLQSIKAALINPVKSLRSE